METLVRMAPLLGLVGLTAALGLFFWIRKQPVGNDRMREIAAAIYQGSMAFLRREYAILAVFVAGVAALLAWKVGSQTALAFLSGAVCSSLAGFFGMQAATRANVRTAEAARSSGQDRALLVAFNGGAIMGLAVASLGLIGVGLWFLARGQPGTAAVINGFAMGASSIALFARVGGGIYTKAADVGSDLVGTLEAGIPEDDPRNPGVIADNVGDNVGDVAGMGADIFESYVGSIIATIAIGATLTTTGLARLAGGHLPGPDTQMTLMALPLVLATLGLVASLLGIGTMRGLSRLSPAAALRYSTFIAAGLFLIAAGLVIRRFDISNEVFFAVLIGTGSGIAIGLITEYYTSAGPVRSIVQASKTGAATNIIRGPPANWPEPA